MKKVICFIFILSCILLSAVTFASINNGNKYLLNLNTIKISQEQSTNKKTIIFHIFDKDGKEATDTKLIDSSMINIKVDTNNPSKTIYEYKYLEQDKEPIDNNWNKLAYNLFYKDMNFYEKEKNQWIKVHIIDTEGNEAEKVFGLKRGTLTNPPDNPITPLNYTNSLGAGFDVTWDQFENSIKKFEEKQVVNLKKAGFRHVRIRTDKQATQKELFEHLDKSIECLLRHGITPIIATGIKEPKEKKVTNELKNYYVTWWKTVANRYKNYSHKIAFNLFIEISSKSELSDWNILNDWYNGITSAIRQETKTHNIIYASTNVSDPSQLPNLVVPDTAGDYYFAEWHRWAAGPGKRNGGKLWTTGTYEEKQAILKQINYAKKWSEQTGKPTWLGAWMPGYYNYNDNVYISQQVEFSKFLINELNKAKIPYAVNAFPNKFYDDINNQWYKEFLPVIEAINGEATIDSQDLDGDGLTNDEELTIYNTNPNNADTDGDNIIDSKEILYHFNPLDPKDSELMDSDGDGMNNAIEIHYGFNPLDSSDKNNDPDKDGVDNIQEIKMLSNPLNPDSRGTGLNDAESDFDKDGLTNIEELEKLFTNPNIKDKNIKNKKTN